MKLFRLAQFGWAVVVNGAVELVRLLCHLVPRRTDLWVFGSWKGLRFADNARYFFLYCATVAPRAPRCVWISGDRAIVEQLRRDGLEAYHRWSLRGIACALRAKVFCFDFRTTDIAYALAGGAVKVNLWHGIPLKRIEGDVDDRQPLGRRGPLRRRLVRFVWSPQDYERYDLLIAPGPEPWRRFQSAFGLGSHQVLVTGYPRNDNLFGVPWARRGASDVDREVGAALERERAAGVRLLGYFPTWRDLSTLTGRTREIPLPLRELDEVLATHRARLVCKMHFGDAATFQGTTADDLPHITLLPPRADLYQHLGLLDALITDYSSVYFDYLLLDRPILFYPHDLAEYQTQHRSLYYDYDQVTPGPKAVTPEALVAGVTELLADYDRVTETWRAERARVRSTMHSFVDARSAERCLAEISARLGAPWGTPNGNPQETPPAP